PSRRSAPQHRGLPGEGQATGRRSRAESWQSLPRTAEPQRRTPLELRCRAARPSGGWMPDRRSWFSLSRVYAWDDGLDLKDDFAESSIRRAGQSGRDDRGSRKGAFDDGLQIIVAQSRQIRHPQLVLNRLEPVPHALAPALSGLPSPLIAGSTSDLVCDRPRNTMISREAEVDQADQIVGDQREVGISQQIAEEPRAQIGAGDYGPSAGEEAWLGKRIPAVQAKPPHR